MEKEKLMDLDTEDSKEWLIQLIELTMIAGTKNVNLNPEEI